ncbi:ras-related protein Rab-3D isoform X2 [Alligator mississippiensis]|uniref:ras-related protein Rab-3D isoform X2 n=1 Tax=Alligator mississippiensis TaxID=8496 RepID=UPI00287812B2|nr:ras-related protein Rab-3D isoform X2 [Alligator mississippiensis]
MPGVQSRLLNPADHVTVPLEAPAEPRHPAALHPAPPRPGTPICLPFRSPAPVLSAPGSMQKDGDGGSLAGVAHLFVLATAWGMQVWVTFISGFVLARGVGRHVFGQVQSKLFPWYFHTLLGCAALNLALAAVAGRPWHQLSSAETLQMASAGEPRPAPPDAADQSFDYMFKLLLIGNSSVGKTSLLFRYAEDTFTPSFVSTVGIDFKVKTVYRRAKRVKLQIWDTAGQERYRTITTAYYRGAMGFLLVYDVANAESFSAVQDWATQIKTYSWDNAQVILVGNKCDLEDDRVVPTEEGRRLAHELGFEFFEASAKDNINVKQVFERLVDVICEKMNESLDVSDAPAADGKGARLSEVSPAPTRSCAC